MLDLIYSRYGGNANSILALPFIDGFEIVSKGFSALNDDKLFLRWAIGYQFTMDFDEFKREIGISDNNTDNRSSDEILDNVKNLMEGF